MEEIVKGIFFKDGSYQNPACAHGDGSVEREREAEERDRWPENVPEWAEGTGAELLPPGAWEGRQQAGSGH